MPGAGLTGGLNSDVNVVLGEQPEQFLVRCEVDFGTPSVVLDHLGSPAIRRDQHPADLILLDGLDKVAVTQGASRCRRVGTIQEGRPDNDHNHHE